MNLLRNLDQPGWLRKQREAVDSYDVGPSSPWMTKQREQLNSFSPFPTPQPPSYQESTSAGNVAKNITSGLQVPLGPLGTFLGGASSVAKTITDIQHQAEMRRQLARQTALREFPMQTLADRSSFASPRGFQSQSIPRLEQQQKLTNILQS